MNLQIDRLHKVCMVNRLNCSFQVGGHSVTLTEHKIICNKEDKDSTETDIDKRQYKFRLETIGGSNVDPLTPHFYIVKLGYRGIHYSLIFALKHRL